MMWNWLSKKIARTERPQRRKVDIDIPFEQHSYRIEDFDIDSETTVEEPKQDKA
ncbi:hypothetical protein TUM4261_08710 [Shewanella sp. c952]|uniref:hypothetical protein n=1 Tax=Shewanella sp. c952 TaxID=2815913 RepID=UPI001BC283F4|nr:hypothetical protein [Shewanella sp. c952]GIU05952.1 hypothetical protein TUM4261_08710 [Shewanella sp. c952]